MNEYSSFDSLLVDIDVDSEFDSVDSDSLASYSDDYFSDDSFDTSDDLLSESPSNNEVVLSSDVSDAIIHMDNTITLFFVAFMCVFLIKFIGRMFNN